MPISVQCPGCGKKLKAKDELAGKRVKCPSCGQVLGIPLPLGRPDSPAKPAQTPSESLVQAVARGDASEIAGFIDKQNFTVIEVSEASDGGGKAALTAEVDDFQVLVAFTSKDHAGRFAGATPELLDVDGSMSAFDVTGSALLTYLPEDCGVLLNPESDDCVVLPPSLIEQIKTVVLKQREPQATERESLSERQSPQAQILRKQVMAFLEDLGFRPARWLPLPDLERQLRPASDIAARLLALAALFTWVSAPESAATSERVRKHIRRSGLGKWLTSEEAQIVSLPRGEVQQAHADAIGWKLENMWPLAWVLGFEAEPTMEASQIDEAISGAILFEFLSGLDDTVEGLVQKLKLRAVEEVISLEDRFYCAHNAVRSAQLGENTVPQGFHPVIHGGAIHERRHSLTWCLSPGTAWEDTDLST